MATPKHFLKIIAGALVLLVIIGILCYRNVTPIDAISGATPTTEGLQEGGALTYFKDGTGR